MCLLDRNKCDFSGPDEISYSSKIWFPEVLFIRVTFKKNLCEPLVLVHNLYLKERGTFSTYKTQAEKEKVTEILEAKDLRKLSKRKKSRSRRRW